jgi:hypothetical protein
MLMWIGLIFLGIRARKELLKNENDLPNLIN